MATRCQTQCETVTQANGESQPSSQTVTNLGGAVHGFVGNVLHVCPSAGSALPHNAHAFPSVAGSSSSIPGPGQSSSQPQYVFPSQIYPMSAQGSPNGPTDPVNVPVPADDIPLTPANSLFSQALKQLHLLGLRREERPVQGRLPVF